MRETGAVREKLRTEQYFRNSIDRSKRKGEMEVFLGCPFVKREKMENIGVAVKGTSDM